MGAGDEFCIHSNVALWPVSEGQGISFSKDPKCPLFQVSTPPHPTQVRRVRRVRRHFLWWGQRRPRSTPLALAVIIIAETVLWAQVAARVPIIEPHLLVSVAIQHTSCYSSTSPQSCLEILTGIFCSQVKSWQLTLGALCFVRFFLPQFSYNPTCPLYPQTSLISQVTRVAFLANFSVHQAVANTVFMGVHRAEGCYRLCSLPEEKRWPSGSSCPQLWELIWKSKPHGHVTAQSPLL